MVASPSSAPMPSRSGRRISKPRGMGSAYGFGGIGKILGPVGLALILGSSNYLKPDAPLPQNSDPLHLSRLLLPDGRGGLSFLRHRDPGQVDRADRTANWPPPPPPTTYRRGCLGHADPTAADLAGDQAVIRAPSPAARGRGGVERDRGWPPHAPACSTSCTSRSCSACCCRARPRGIETDPVTFFHVIETIARGDASTAWCQARPAAAP